MGPQKAVSKLVNYREIRDDLPEVEFGELTAPGMGAGRGGGGRGGIAAVDAGIAGKRAPGVQPGAAVGTAGEGRGDPALVAGSHGAHEAAAGRKDDALLAWAVCQFCDDGRQTYLLYKQNQLLRQYAVGNYRKLTHDISKDPAMLVYLNNNQNVKAHPNENYARELMELFTLGIGNYSENDIKESARSFTGWTNAGDQFVGGRSSTISA